MVSFMVVYAIASMDSGKHLSLSQYFYYMQIKCELRLLTQFSFNLNPDFELPPMTATRRKLLNDRKLNGMSPSAKAVFSGESAEPLKAGVRDMLVKVSSHHSFSIYIVYYFSIIYSAGISSGRLLRHHQKTMAALFTRRHTTHIYYFDRLVVTFLPNSHSKVLSFSSRFHFTFLKRKYTFPMDDTYSLFILHKDIWFYFSFAK